MLQWNSWYRWFVTN